MEQSLNDQLLQAAIQIMIAVLIPVVGTLVCAGDPPAHQADQGQCVSADQLAVVDGLVKSFVLAAEQYGLGDILVMTGKQKKAWVVNRVSEELVKRGDQVDMEHDRRPGGSQGAGRDQQAEAVPG